MIRKLLHILWVIIASVLLLIAMAVIGTSVSPIYDFPEPEAFSGPDIFNPYAALDTTVGWKRANFHTHTRVKGPFPPNECEAWPKETYDTYMKLGYDIVTFSNHNEITTHFDPSLQVNVYEQGYSPFKFHKLVFGSSRVVHFDPLLPFMASQKQFELNYLGAGSDFIQINHPYRTEGLTRRQLELLTGYEIMELDTNISTENEYWDWALSAGHYSFGLANDDLHHATNPNLIGIRCNFVCTPSGRYEDLKEALLGGCYYAMRVPNYGDGDWAAKIEGNAHLPYIESIGLRGNTVYMTLSQKADSIRVNGFGHSTLALLEDSSNLYYTMTAADPYVRMTAFFPGGEVIYTNPFARYDASEGIFDDPAPTVKWPLTILYNLGLLILIGLCFWAFVKLFARRRR